MTVIHTSRLALRPVEERDIPAVVAGCRDSEVPRYIPLIPAPYGESDAREWLAGAGERWQDKGERSFALTFSDEDELLGVVSIRLRPGGSVGYWLRPEVRGQGIMSEAVGALVEWARVECGVSGLYITAHPENLASQRVAEKAGFVRAGLCEHEPAFADGTRQAVRFDQPGR